MPIGDQGGTLYANTAGVIGVPTNATWTGPWLRVAEYDAVGFQVNLTGTGNPVGTWGVDVSADPDPNVNPVMTPTALTLTADMIAQNPSGSGATINFLFNFDPKPAVGWMRFKLTISSGGSASQLLKVAAVRDRKGVS